MSANFERKPSVLQPIPCDFLASGPIRGEKESMRRFLLLLVVACPLLLRAELPPSAYESMHKAASDLLTIEVLRVEIEPGDAPERQNVHVMALVNGVTRSASSVKEGDLINVVYTVTARGKGWAGPGEIPILEEKDKTMAYLAKDTDKGEFHPAAGAMSFRNF
ncbi:MAG: hypothetical protein D4R65_08935 [Verrucomicrobiaceae bacterium]|nr:MAG: hypothetical protein D4R65_08935 [Verrucomicrobiaceae bacterium]